MLCMIEFDQEDWVVMYGAIRDAAKKVGIKKVGQRTNLLWKLGVKRGEDLTYLDEDLKGK